MGKLDYSCQRKTKLERLRMCRMESSVSFFLLLASPLWDSALCHTPGSVCSMLSKQRNTGEKNLQSRIIWPTEPEVSVFADPVSCMWVEDPGDKRLWWRMCFVAQKEVCYHHCMHKKVNIWQARWVRNNGLFCSILVFKSNIDGVF